MNSLRQLLRRSLSAKAFIILFIVYFVIGAVYIYISQPQLIYEWKDILHHLQTEGAYKYQNRYSAYMPPMYPYYLYFFWKLWGDNSNPMLWLNLSIIFQAIVYYYAIYFLLKSILKKDFYTCGAFLCFMLILLFPSVLFGTFRNSPFALTTAIYMFCFSFAFRYLYQPKTQYALCFLFFGILGMYIRWDFIAYFGLLLLLLGLNYQLKTIYYFAIPLVLFLIYAPWSYRNYQQLGKFTFNTSSAFNFAKGHHARFDPFKMSNLPYDEVRGVYATDSLVIAQFKTEAERDQYLNALSQQYLIKFPAQAAKNNLMKIWVNFTQYFPEAFNNKKYKLPFVKGNNHITLAYSLFFILYTLLLLYALLKYPFREFFMIKRRNFFYQFVLVSFVFYFFINSIIAPPLPRYILFYMPFFTLFLFKFYIFKENEDRVSNQELQKFTKNNFLYPD